MSNALHFFTFYDPFHQKIASLHLPHPQHYTSGALHHLLLAILYRHSPHPSSSHGPLQAVGHTAMFRNYSTVTAASSNSHCPRFIACIATLSLSTLSISSRSSYKTSLARRAVQAVFMSLITKPCVPGEANSGFFYTNTLALTCVHST